MDDGETTTGDNNTETTSDDECSWFDNSVDEEGADMYGFLNVDCTSYSNNYHVIAANKRHGLPLDLGIDEDPEHVELCVVGHAWKLAYHGDGPASGESRTAEPTQQSQNHLSPKSDEMLVTIYTSKHKPGSKKVVVARTDSIRQKWPPPCRRNLKHGYI